MDIDTLSQRTKSTTTIALVAALWATVVGVYLLIASTWDRSFAVITSVPPTTYEVVKNKLLDYASIVAVTGFDSASGLFIPTLLALCPLAIRRHRRAALLVTGGLTLAVCLAWPSSSIGILYLPTALLLLFAAVRTSADPAHAI
jgi:hypothetical protein